MTSLRALVLVVLVAGPTTALANNWGPAKRIDAYLDALATQGMTHGSLAISEKGVLKYQRAIGSAVIEPGRNEAADTGTRYRIGPVSTLFTATLFMQLAESGSVTLDNKLAEFFPDLPNALDITYRDLLAHRSGLSDFARMPDFQTWRTRPHPRNEVLDFVGKAGPLFPPRERVEYSGTNYLVLSYVLEKVYDKPYAELVRTRIADKLGLARTYYGQRMNALRHEALAHEFSGGAWVLQPETDPDLLLGAGGMVSSPGDLVRFIDALFAGRIVSPTSLESMRGTNDAALGLPPVELAGRKAFGHSGRIDGYSACVYHFPDAGISVSFTSNASVIAPDAIVDEIVALVFDRKRRPPTAGELQLPGGKND